MSNRDKKDSVPELRFPEFRGKRGWSSTQLGKIGEFIGGGTPNTSVSDYWDGDIQWFTPSEMKQKYISKSKRTITNQGLKNSSAKLLPKGALLLSTRATVGDVGIAANSCTTNQGFQSLIVEKTEVNIFWYYWLLQHKEQLLRRSSGSTFLEIGKAEIQKVDALAPEKTEQQKIADCLSSIDNLITAHSQKLDALKAHKKGLVQQLSPTEGENAPKLRFVEFEDEWNSVYIDDLAILTMGNAFKSTDFVESGIQLIRMGNLYQGSLKLDRSPVFLPVSFKKEYEKFIVKPSELLMSMTGTVGKKDYGFVVQMPDSCPEFMLNQRVAKIVPKEPIIKKFLLQLLKSDAFLVNLYSLPGGTKQANLSASQLKEIALRVPIKEEQYKISECLNTMDKIVIAQIEKIEFLKSHKKSLLEKLFPSMEEAIK